MDNVERLLKQIKDAVSEVKDQLDRETDARRLLEKELLKLKRRLQTLENRSK
ncbi:MAG: hypothetical protein ACYDHY_06420 [Acidiferrobacterales bacterium]